MLGDAEAIRPNKSELSHQESCYGVVVLEHATLLGDAEAKKLKTLLLLRKRAAT